MKSTIAKSVKEKVTSDTRKIDSLEEEVIMPSTTQGSIPEEETEALDEFGNMGEDLASVDVSMEPLSHQLIMTCTVKMQQAAEQLVLVYKRVSLDDALDDSLREELLTQLSEGAAHSAESLALLHSRDVRSQGEIATAAMATINQFLAKQNFQQILEQRHTRHFQ